jgi:cap3/cap4 methyltransferase
MRAALQLAQRKTGAIRPQRPPTADETETQNTSATAVPEDDELPARGSLHWSGPPPRVLHDAPVRRQPYRRRKGEVKCAVHWGQRKLLMSEVQLLLPPYGNGFQRRYLIVYVGSAPGGHLEYLDRLFDSRHSWHLVDPGAFVPTLRTLPNVRIDNTYFDNAKAYSILTERIQPHCPALAAVFAHVVDTATVSGQRQSLGADVPAARVTGDLDAARMAEEIPTMWEPELALPIGLHLLGRAAATRTPALFVSDVRSGTAEMSNFDGHVVENMRAQATWAHIVDADFSMLKYRLPYSTDAQRQYRLGPYPAGDVVLPVWGPQTTTECRLVIRPGAPWVEADVVDHEERMYYLNAILRERVHFNHAASPHAELDNRFDSAAEVAIWETFIRESQQPQLTVKALVDRTTAVLGETFEDIRRKRDALLTATEAVAGGSSKRFRAEQPRQNEISQRQASTMVNALLEERKRHVWWRNVAEQDGERGLRSLDGRPAVG